MAPIRSHLSWLFETRGTGRKVSYWYGARSGRELFYGDWLQELDGKHANFDFRLAYSEAEPGDDPEVFRGFIHTMLEEQYLSAMEDAAEKEYYLCGPPAMVSAVKELLGRYGVPDEQVHSDEF